MKSGINGQNVLLLQEVTHAKAEEKTTRYRPRQDQDKTLQVLTKDEVRRVIVELIGTCQLIVQMMHSKGISSLALERKYPDAKHETKWQFLFPLHNVAKDPRSPKAGRALKHYMEKG